MSRTNLEDLNAKEKDNRWLQLPICPQLHADPSSSCSSEKDSPCEDYAHPSPKVLSRNKLKNGFVVCCHDYVFRHSGKGGCFKKDDCIYYHPNSTRQEMMVKIAGKVNKDIKMLYTQRLAAEQQRLIHTTAQYPYLTTGGASSFVTPFHPYLYAGTESSPSSSFQYHLHPRHSTETTAPPHHPEPHHQGSPPKADSEEGNNRKRIRLDPEASSSTNTLLHSQPSLSTPQGTSLQPLSVLPLQGQHLGLLPFSPYFGLNYGMYPQYFPSN